MGEKTGIAWCDHTFNPWWGCVKVSPACDYCYAETWAKRMGFNNLWNGVRRTFGEEHWREPLTWNRKAEKEGVIRRVFCGSMCDIFEQHRSANLDEYRSRLFSLITYTQNLEYILLTKRPENIPTMIPALWREKSPDNVRIMVTAENQEMADLRIPILLQNWKGKTSVSVEPMIESIDLMDYLWEHDNRDRLSERDAIDWVICGGESGPGARPMHPDWARSLRDQCKSAGVPFLFKQWGEWVPVSQFGYISSKELFNLPHHDWSNIESSLRMGKKKTGRLLDGVEYLEFPK